MAKVRYRFWKDDNSGDVYKATWLVIDGKEEVKFDSNGNAVVEIENDPSALPLIPPEGLPPSPTIPNK